MRLRVLGGILLVMATILVAPGAALAACGAPPSLITSVEEAHTVFVGRTVEVTNRGRTAEMEVLQIWKGRDLPQYVTVAGGSADATEVDSDDRIFENGRTYLVFPHNRTSPFTDDRCTATRLYDTPTGKAIPANLEAAVGADQARVPVAAPANDGAIDGSQMGPWIVGMGLLLLGLLLVWGYTRLTRGDGARASARRQERFAVEKAAVAAAAAAEEERPTPITHADSPFRKRGIARIPFVGGLSGRFRRSGLDNARKMSSQGQKRRN